MWRDYLYFKNSKKETHYASEFTQFMDEFLKEHPEVVEDQKKGWNIYWNKSVDWQDWEKAKEDSVPEKPYHYE